MAQKIYYNCSCSFGLAWFRYQLFWGGDSIVQGLDDPGQGKYHDKQGKARFVGDKEALKSTQPLDVL